MIDKRKISGISYCVSYPKSGRTWLRVMFADLKIPIEFTHLDTGADKRSWGKTSAELATPRPMNGKTVFLHRDPRDTVISFYHEMTKRNPLPFGRRLRFTLTGRMPPRTIDAFVRSPRFGVEKIVLFNLACARSLHALCVRYGDLREAPVSHLDAILRYLGHDVPRELIEKAVANNTFEKMQAREAAGDYKVNKLRPSDPSDPNTFKVRRGKVGGYRDEMDDETQSYADAILARHSYFDQMAKLTGQDAAS